jgi:hypothetical protein
LHDHGIKRYGFHGLSYAFIAAELGRRAPKIAAGKVIVAHLGSGASLCALDGGKSRDCSMGFSTLDGIPMATRCGALDPGVVLHLLGPKGRTLRNIEDMFYHRSGLLGVSGISGDTRDLLKDERVAAREAISRKSVPRSATACGGWALPLIARQMQPTQPSSAHRPALSQRSSLQRTRSRSLPMKPSRFWRPSDPDQQPIVSFAVI